MVEQEELISILVQPQTTSNLLSPDAFSAKHGLDEKWAREVAKISDSSMIDILNDQPTSEDAFGFDALARTLSNVILAESSQTPITISINGKWGTGKTSILKMIEVQARLLEFPCIWLNAWILDHPRDLSRAIQNEIQHEFEFIKQKKTQESVREALINFTATTLTSHSFKRLVQALLKDSKHKPSRLVVFVDDIDRALPEQMTTSLRSLKLILEAPQCAFVLAMDMDIVAHAIESHYQNQSKALSRDGQIQAIKEGFGYDYLEKLVQICVEVPVLTRQAAYAYLHELGIADEVMEIIQWAPDEDVLNPRSLKRYVNWLSISLQLIRSVQMPRRVRNVTALRAMALQRDHPEIYEILLAPGQVIEYGQVQPLDKLISDTLEKRDDFHSDMSDHFRYYLTRKLRRPELVEFAQFVRETPMLNVERRKYRARKE